MYREHVLCFLPKYLATGLSLCIQGTSDLNNKLPNTERFIPVYTGNICFSIKSITLLTVYPCVYREHLLRALCATKNGGLSLCIQGTYASSTTFANTKRFIPVYTGNIPIITYCFIIKILAVKFLPIFWDIFHQNHNI